MYSFIKNNYKEFLILFVLYIFLCLYLVINNNFDNKLIMNLTCNKSDMIQVFFKNKDSIFDENNSKIKYITKDINANLIYKIPSNTNTLRIDFGQQSDMNCKINYINFLSGYKNINLMETLSNSFFNTINVDNNKALSITTASNDSFIQINYVFNDYRNITTLNKLLALFVLFFSVGYLMIYIYKNHFELFLILMLTGCVKILFINYSSIPMNVNEYFSHDEGTYLRYVNYIFENGLWGYFKLQESIEAAFGNLFYIYTMLSFSDNSIWFLRYFNAIILGSGSIVLTYFIMSNLKTISKTNVLLATLIVGFYGEILYFSVSYLTEPLIIFLFLLFIFLMQYIFNSNKEKNTILLIALSILAGCIIGFASLVRLIFLPISGILILFSIYFLFKKDIQKAILLIITFLTAIILISPFFYNGYKHSGKPMVATGSGAVLWLGSRVDTNGDEPPYYHLPYDTNKISNNLSHLTLEGDALLKQAAVKNIKENPYIYVKNSLKRIYRLVIGNNYFWFFPYDNFNSYVKNHDIFENIFKLLTIFIATIIGTYSLFTYIFVLFSKNLFLKFITLNSLALILLYIPFLVNQRYGLPVFCLNTILVIYFISANQVNKFYKVLPMIIGIFVFIYTINIL